MALSKASRQWNIKLTQVLTTTNYIQSKLDYSLFMKRSASGIVVFLVYVDDILLTGDDDEKLLQEAKSVLETNFMTKDFGELKYFLGLKVFRSKIGIILI